jgi:ATP-binding cassette subfamily B protein
MAKRSYPFVCRAWVYAKYPAMSGIHEDIAFGALDLLKTTVDPGWTLNRLGSDRMQSVRERKKSSTSVVAYLLQLHGRETRLVGISVAGSVAQIGLTIANVAMISSVIDSADRSIPHAVGVALAILTLAAGAVVAQEISRCAGISAGDRVAGTLRRQLSERLASLERAEVFDMDLHAMHGKLVHSSEQVDLVSLALLGSFVPSVVILFGISIYLFVVAPWLTVALVSAGAITLLVGSRTRTLVIGRTGKFSSARARFAAAALDSLRLRDLISSQDAWPAMLRRLRSTGDEVGATGAELQRSQARFTSVQQFVVGGAVAASVATGGLLTARGRMSHGELIGFIVALGFIQSSVRLATSSFPALVRGREDVARILDFVSQRSERSERSSQGMIRQPTCWELRNVKFGYGNKIVLHDVSLTMRSGDLVGLTGPNGCGKSTLIALLLGWYQPSSGSVLIDGIDAGELDPAGLRRVIGLVQQDPQFLDATIRENLLFGARPDEDAERRLAEALQLSTASSILDLLPLGLDTSMGVAGTRLSGGQRQRLAVARALIRSPRLLLVDEPTNHLDRRSASEMLENLRGLPSEPAVLIVSHDPDVLSMCDVVHQLVDGRVDRSVVPISADGRFER